jgi:predicted PurR-regulated permease PerM
MAFMESSPSLLKRQRLVLLACFGAGLGFLLYTLWGLLTPFLTGFLMAYILRPLVEKLEGRGVPRWLSSMLLMLSLFAAMSAIFFFLIPFLREQIVHLFKVLPSQVDLLNQKLRPLWAFLQPYTGEMQEPSHARDILGSFVKDFSHTLLTFFFGILSRSSAVASFLSLLFFAPLMMFYFLKDWDSIVFQAHALIPQPLRKGFQRILQEVDQALGNYARGQFIVCALLAIYYAVALSLVGHPFGLGLGVLTGFLIFVPYVGVFTGFLLSLLTALVFSQDASLLLLVLGVYALGHLLEGVLLTPLLLGSKTGLHPLWILFALFVTGGLFGLTGVIFCLPLAAVCRVLVLWGVGAYKSSSYYCGRS